MYKNKYLKYKNKYLELKKGGVGDTSINFPSINSYELIKLIEDVHGLISKVPGINLPDLENIEERLQILSQLLHLSVESSQLTPEEHKEHIIKINEEIKLFNDLEEEYTHIQLITNDDAQNISKLIKVIIEHISELKDDDINEHKFFEFKKIQLKSSNDIVVQPGGSFSCNKTGGSFSCNKTGGSFSCNKTGSSFSCNKTGGSIICNIAELIDNALALIPLEGIIEDAIGIVIAIICGDIMGAFIELVGLIPFVGEVPRVIQVFRDIMNFI